MSALFKPMGRHTGLVRSWSERYAALQAAAAASGVVRVVDKMMIA